MYSEFSSDFLFILCVNFGLIQHVNISSGPNRFWLNLSQLTNWRQFKFKYEIWLPIFRFNGLSNFNERKSEPYYIKLWCTYECHNVLLANCSHLRKCIQKPDFDKTHVCIQVEVNKFHIFYLPIQCHKHMYLELHTFLGHILRLWYHFGIYKLVCYIECRHLPIHVGILHCHIYHMCKWRLSER